MSPDTRPRPGDVADAPDVPDVERDRRRFRTTLAKVMSVQVIALALLWLLQRRFTP